MENDALIEQMGKAVKRGAKFLDKRLGRGWRRTMKRHAETFDIRHEGCCVLGTLEHYHGRLRQLNKARVKGMSEAEYQRGLNRLRIRCGADFGFEAPGVVTVLPSDTAVAGFDAQWATLNALWRAELDL